MKKKLMQLKVTLMQFTALMLARLLPLMMALVLLPSAVQAKASSWNEVSAVRMLVQAQTEAQPAADAGVVAELAGPDWNTDLAVFMSDPTNPEGWAKLVLHAVMKGQWGLLVSLLLTMLIAGLRKWVPEATKLGTWFRSRVGAVVTNLSLSLGLGFVTALLGGAPFSLALVVKALTIAFTAAGTWSVWKALNEARDEKKAQEAGVAATSAPSNTLDK